MENILFNSKLNVDIFLAIINLRQLKVETSLPEKYILDNRRDSFPFDFLHEKNQKKNYHYNHILFNLKGIGSFISVSIGLQVEAALGFFAVKQFAFKKQEI